MRPPEEAVGRLFSRSPLPEIAAVAAAHDGSVYLVGGALRDVAVGRDPVDLDIAVGGDLDAFVEAFAAACGRRPVEIGDDWRETRRTKWSHVQVDVARLLGPVEEDLAARDFTINALAVELTPDRCAALAAGGEELSAVAVDRHRGFDDLARRRIRMTSEAVLDRDPLRLLRAVRYLALLDGFDIEPATRAAIAARAATLDGVSAERVQTEWAQLLTAPRWTEALGIAGDLVLTYTLVADLDHERLAAWTAHEDASADALVTRLAAVLLVDAGTDPEGAGRRLAERRWPQAVARRASRAAHAAARLEAADGEEMVGWVLDDREAAAVAVRLAACLDDTPAVQREELAQLVERAAEEAWVTGFDLREWGMREGPALGALLDEVARGQLQRRWPSVAEAREWARRQAGGVAAAANGA